MSSYSPAGSSHMRRITLAADADRPLAAARRRAAPRPRRARGARGLADLRRAARARAARRPPAPRARSRSRPGWTSPSRCTRACWPARRAVPVDPRLRASGSARPCSRRRAPRRRRAGRPHLRHDRRAAAGRAEPRQHPGERARLGGRARPRPRRALAVPAAALARRRADGAAALGDLRDDRGRSAPRRARRRTTTSRSPRSSRPSSRAAARRRRAARRRACAPSCSAARPATPALLERARAAGWPVVADLRPHAGVLAGRPSTAAPLPGRRRRRSPPTARSSSSGPTVAGGGALRTGDLGRFDADGRLVVIGRKSDTIVTGGENVAPAEVEAVLLEHPAVADAAVFGRPDPEWGEAVTAQRRPARARRARGAARVRAASGSPASRSRRRSRWRTRCRARASGKLLRRELR